MKAVQHTLRKVVNDHLYFKWSHTRPACRRNSDFDQSQEPCSISCPLNSSFLSDSDSHTWTLAVGKVQWWQDSFSPYLSHTHTHTHRIWHIYLSHHIM